MSDSNCAVVSSKPPLERLMLARFEIGGIAADSRNVYREYNYASLSAVLGQAEPVLSRFGLMLMQTIDFEAGKDGNPGYHSLTTKIIDCESWEKVDSAAFCVPFMDDIQKVGAHITYARRYMLMILLGLTVSDSDGMSPRDLLLEGLASFKASGRDSQIVKQALRDNVKADVFSEDGFVRSDLSADVYRACSVVLAGLM